MNPIPDSVMQEFERRMAHAEGLQETRRHVVKHHGMVEWRWLSTTPHERHSQQRAQAARWILEARALIRENGHDTWLVCAQARDPDGFAFCSGGGTAAAMRADVGN
jgi:hypothetical protein